MVANSKPSPPCPAALAPQDPDWCADHGYLPSCDMWSAGVVLYYLLSGKTPFEASDVDGILAKVVSGQWGFAGRCWANISSAARDLLLGLLKVGA
jgi:serine/threonine protein kinase